MLPDVTGRFIGPGSHETLAATRMDAGFALFVFLSYPQSYPLIAFNDSAPAMQGCKLKREGLFDA